MVLLFSYSYYTLRMGGICEYCGRFLWRGSGGILAFAKVSSLVTRTPDNSAFRVTSKPKRTRQAFSLPCPFWRRRRDSNPRGLSPKRFSRPPRYDRFDTPALLFNFQSPNGLTLCYSVRLRLPYTTRLYYDHSNTSTQLSQRIHGMPVRFYTPSTIYIILQLKENVNKFYYPLK